MKEKFKISGAIFDLDGTLIDSMLIWDSLGEKYLKVKGINAEQGLNKKLESMSLASSAAYLKNRYKISDSAEKIMLDINKIIEYFYLYEAELKGGVLEFLSLLRTKKIKMCVATLTEKYLAEAVLKRCGVLDYFTEVISYSGDVLGKSKPDIYYNALRILNIKKAEAFVFEDASYAAETAYNAGFNVCGVYDASEKHTDALKKNSTVYIKSFKEAGNLFD